MTRRFVIGLSLLAVMQLCAEFAPAGGTEQPTSAAVESPGSDLVPRQGLAIGAVGKSGRQPLHTDAIEAAIVAGQWRPPSAGEQVKLADGTSKAWVATTANEDGVFDQTADQELRGGYLYVPVEMTDRRVMLLDATGHRMVYVNGRPRVGDAYRSGNVRLPILLQAGTNDLLFRASRGALRMRLSAPSSPLLLYTRDATLPDIRVGESLDAWGAVVLINATREATDSLYLETTGSGVETVRTALPDIPPLSTRKVGFRLRGPAPSSGGKHEVTLKLIRGGGSAQVLATASVDLRAREPQQSYKVTFRSDIDGSVQYYAVQPARQPGTAPRRPAMFLSLHGAGVQATAQADAYYGKSWGHVVAATNRRPFGFDWEDWGRLDALEVLEHAQQRLDTDPQRTYLTGHSMGGHGTWHLGVTYPDRFGAIGPSAGWISFWSYSGAERLEGKSPVEAIMQRATAASDTLTLARNFDHFGIYVLHGDADDNVPVEQARQMRTHLSEWHRDLAWHEQPGAGHWWDASDEPGAGCVDWAPMFDFFARHQVPTDDSIRHIDFTTASPGVSAWSHWVGIEAQQRMLEPASVDVRCDPGRRRFVGTTRNVARLALRVGHLPAGEPVTVDLDDQPIPDIPWPASGDKVWLHRAGEKWSAGGPASPDDKGPHRYGPFKDAFRHRVMLVYGTRGTEAENDWSLSKARYDAEMFWYRGNASVDVVADADFDPLHEPDRSVIVYGNSDSNSAWRQLLSDSPVVLRRGKVGVGPRELAGEDLACLLVRPRPGSARASVGVVGGTGLPGMRLTDRLPYFVSGVAYPDCIVLGTDVLQRGAAGVRLAGFFGLDWNIATGDFAWAE